MYEGRSLPPRLELPRLLPLEGRDCGAEERVLDPVLLPPVRPYPARSTPAPEEEPPGRLVEVLGVAYGVDAPREEPEGRLIPLPLPPGAYPLSSPRVEPDARVFPIIL